MSLYKRILNRFPPQIVYSFAYGSGVKKQIGYENSRPSTNLIDFIFCVRNPLEWHTQNLQLNPKDYSGLRILGNKFISRYQENRGAGIYFNTLVPIPEEGVVIKYGIVSEEHLLVDLNDWIDLYVAGRLHKPIEVVHVAEDCKKLTKAIHKNFLNALHTSLLLLPENFSNFQLFHTIASLSYKGDFRMVFGENKKKVDNIVKAQIDDFYRVYIPALRELNEHVAISTDCKHFQQDKSTEIVEKHLQCLPSNLLKHILRNVGAMVPNHETLKKFSQRRDLKQIVETSVNDIVWWSSVTQSIKNIPTAGVWKSLRYSWKKALKTFSN